MANFSYAWTGPAQVALTSSVDQGAQYRQIVFALIDYLRDLCGYTIERSCDGVTAGAGDLIVDESDIVWGTENTENHSWALLRPPTGKGNPSGGGQLGVIVNCDHINAADLTPQNVNLILGHGPVLTNGDTETRCTLQTEDNALQITIVPWAEPISGSICRYENSNNDLIFLVKANGELFFRTAVIIASDPDNAIGNNTLWMFAVGTVVDCLTVSQLAGQANFRSLRADGTNPSASVAMHSSALNLSNWTNGQEAVQGRVPWRDIEILSNGIGTEARNLGLFRDVLACPPQTPFNQADPNDDGGEAPYEWRSIGDLVVPSNADVT
jgi:hypothetical protein